MAKQLRLTLTYDIFESEEELTSVDLRLMQAAREATYKAYAPYSGFLVGAAILLEDFTLHTGNNQENAAYPSGLCAERTALFGLSALHPDKKILAIAVTARKSNSNHYIGAAPCGGCRQVMAEYENRQKAPISTLIQMDQHTFYRCHSVSDLLPLQFSQENLLEGMQKI